MSAGGAGGDQGAAMTKFVLAVDGGGMRGIAPARMLAEFDKVLAVAGKKRVAEAFDLYAGTSTGSIVAAALAASTSNHPTVAPYADPENIVAIYRDDGPKIFPKWRWWVNGLFRQKYSSKPIAASLTRVFGDLRLGELDRNFIAMFYSMRPGAPQAVFAHGGPAYGPGSGDEWYRSLRLREVVQGSAAAPTYFNPSAVNYPAAGPDEPSFVAVDGGIYANNPAMCGYVEARRKFPGEDIVVVSLGCGMSEASYPDRVRRWGVLEWMSLFKGVPLLKAIGDGQASSTIHQMETVLGDRYFRFSFPLAKVNGRLDDASPENLDALEQAARETVLRERAKLDRLVALLP